MYMLLGRLVGALIYLAAAGAWMVLTVIIGVLRCDDSCSSNSTRWADDPHAWQYDVMPYLGIGGAFLAILALTLSLLRRELGLAIVGAHAGLFLVNAVLLLQGGDVNGAVVVLPSVLAAAAAYVAVGGPRPRAG